MGNKTPLSRVSSEGGVVGSKMEVGSQMGKWSVVVVKKMRWRGGGCDEKEFAPPWRTANKSE